jgi:hypothetical protein
MKTFPGMSVDRHHFMKSLAAISLVLLLLAGLTGISVHVHYCHGNRTAVDFFPEILKSETSCQCESNAKDHSDCSISQHFKHNSCCSDQYFFKKLSVETNIQVVQAGIKDIFFFPTAELASSVLSTVSYRHIIHKPPVVPKPPGRKRIVLFHQIRVSSTQSDCQG